MVKLICLMFFLLVYGCDSHDIFPHYTQGRLNIHDLERILTETNFDPDTRTYQRGNTLLMLTSRDGRVEMVELLLEAGANIKMRNHRGKTAFMFAVEGGSTIIVNRLLEAGADVHARDNYGNTSLMWAAKGGQLNVIDILLKEGADINTRNNEGSTALGLAADEGNNDAFDRLSEAEVEQ